MFENIQGNVIKDSGECSRRFRGTFLKIPGNEIKDSRKFSKRFRRMFKNIQGNVWADSGECSERFEGMFKQILSNVQKDSGESKFRFISWNIACFLSNFAVKLLPNNEKHNYWAILLKKIFSSLHLINSLLSLITDFLT